VSVVDKSPKSAKGAQAAAATPKAAPVFTPVAELPGLLARAVREGHRLALGGASDASPSSPRRLRLVPAQLPGISLDAQNALAIVDGGVSVRALGHRLAREGYVLPLSRPWPSLPWTSALSLAPPLLALLQQATLCTVDGEPIHTPAAPRASLGPGMTSLLAARPPLAVLLEGHLRVVAKSHAVVVHETAPHLEDAAARLVEHLDCGRAFCVDVVGTTLVVLQGAGTPLPPSQRVRVEAGAFAHPNAAAARFASGVRLLPDAGAITRALQAGARVVAWPQQGVVGALHRARTSVNLTSLHDATAAAVAALVAPTTPSAPAAPNPSTPVGGA
jgi:hypothetical protein